MSPVLGFYPNSFYTYSIMHESEFPVYIEAMFQSETYPHPTEHIEMIQTHISWVFLTGQYAYKLKKPLYLSFLDFSTLAKRKFYCEQELQLNTRISADLYLDVIPLHRQDARFNLKGRGEIVDYCVKMRQFDQADLLDQRLRHHHRHNPFDPVWMDDLAQQVACFHADQTSSMQFAQPQQLAEHIQTNLDIISAFDAQKDLTSDFTEAITSLKNFARSTLQSKEALLKSRLYDGFIRPCHGDLHLKNITLMNNRPCIFDCIEFNEEFRTIDTMNDVAFLVMDCEAHARSDLGLRFLSRYLERTGDYAGLHVFTLYLFYRATVRAKVALLLAMEVHDSNEHQSQLQIARSYINLAAIYTRAKQAELFVIGGLSGSGKSHLALLGCAIERAIIIRSDATRKRIAKNHPSLGVYSRDMHIHTYHTMFADARIALKAGFSVILDATFLHPDSRQQAHTLSQEVHVSLHFYWLDIERTVIEKQIKQRQAEAKDISDADLTVFHLQEAEYQRPDESWIQCIHTSDRWPDVQSACLLGGDV